MDNMATTTYTFTPNSGQCAGSANMTITVNTSVVPTFTQVAPICSGEALSALPVTSNNGITGTWSPALDNMATTTYTFTPNAGQCASSASMTITVNTSVVPTFTQVAPICSGEALSALPVTSNNGIVGTWSPALDNMATTTYTFTPNSGQCAGSANMTITVNTSVVPTFTQVAPICSGEALSALPVTSNNGITGTWSPALDNMATTTYTFTPNSGQCAGSASMTITVNTSVVPTFTQVAPICSGEALSALPVTSNNGIVGTWSPALDNMATTTYTFTPNAGQCAGSASMTITVNTSVVPTFNPVNPICQGETLSALPVTSNNGITGTWSPALDNSATTTYTFTPNSGQCAGSASMTITVN
ncbi:serine protease inhibitor, partial [Flavobacterium arsenatis]|nr:serine protease inhibitor [Flavobacterium arsenatis]